MTCTAREDFVQYSTLPTQNSVGGRVPCWWRQRIAPPCSACPLLPRAAEMCLRARGGGERKTRCGQILHMAGAGNHALEVHLH